MHDDSGVKKILTLGFVYRFFQWMVGSDSAGHWQAEHHWRCKPGDRVLDVGCGVGTLLNFLPESVSYVGIEPNENYVRKATDEFGSRGRFHLGTATDLLADGYDELGEFDVVICVGVLHHLNDDQISDVCELASRVLAPGGRLLLTEPVHTQDQSRLGRALVSMDRGQNVLTEAGWLDRVRPHFADVDSRIVGHLLRIPYVHILIECHQPPA